MTELVPNWMAQDAESADKISNLAPMGRDRGYAGGMTRERSRFFRGKSRAIPVSDLAASPGGLGASKASTTSDPNGLAAEGRGFLVGRDGGVGGLFSTAVTPSGFAGAWRRQGRRGERGGARQRSPRRRLRGSSIPRAIRRTSALRGRPW